MLADGEAAHDADGNGADLDIRMSGPFFPHRLPGFAAAPAAYLARDFHFAPARLRQTNRLAACSVAAVIRVTTARVKSWKIASAL